VRRDASTLCSSVARFAHVPRHCVSIRHARERIHGRATLMQDITNKIRPENERKRVRGRERGEIEIAEWRFLRSVYNGVREWRCTNTRREYRKDDDKNVATRLPSALFSGDTGIRHITLLSTIVMRHLLTNHAMVFQIVNNNDFT